MNLSKLLSFEQGRIRFFETLTKHPENWQQNPTPLCIVRKMLDKTSLEEKKILVLFNIEFLQVLVEERKINPENIYYIADNELEYLSAIKIFKVQSYKLSDFSVPALKKLIVGIDMKFDLVFSNPPYNANVDIKILNEIIDIADEFVVVHPSTWILDRKGKTKMFKDLKNKVENNLQSVDFFNGNNIFNIELFVPCMITHLNKKYSGNTLVTNFSINFEVSDITDITKFGEKWSSLVKPFTNKFLSCDSIMVHKTLHDATVDEEKYYCQLAGVRGTPNRSKNSNHMLLSDFYTMIMKNDGNKGIRNLNVRKDAWLVWKFDTEAECDNFINYLKTDFSRFLLSVLKNTQNNHYGEMDLIPWLDFTEEWDDDKLFAKFDVSQELQDYIRDFLPDFHGIRK
jgi:16S rRNA G966 N2-methylase RsmD